MNKYVTKNILALFVVVMMLLAVGCNNDLNQDLPENGTIQELPITGNGAATDGAVIDGAATDGAVTDGAATDGTVTDGAVTDGAATDGTVTDGSTGEATTDGSSEAATDGNGETTTDGSGEAVTDGSGEATTDGSEAATDGAATDGAATDGSSEATTDGGEAATDGAATDGAATDGGSEATTDGTSTDGGDANAITHVIQFGETVGIIAQRYGVSIQDIVVANNLPNENAITAGDTLQIVAGAADFSGGRGEGEGPPQFDPNNYFIHVVSYGETLNIIAQRYGFALQELADYNGIVNVNRIDLFQELKIPNR